MLCVCRNCVAKLTFDSLKPTVFALATLLPTTSIVVSAAVMPVSDVVMVDCRPMVLSPFKDALCFDPYSNAPMYFGLAEYAGQ